MQQPFASKQPLLDTPAFPRVFCLFILVATSLLFFCRLGEWALWQDEANAACLARNTLRFGFPYVFDGLNVIWPNISDVTPYGHYWVLWGWLPIYLNALVFSIAGISTFTARLASAIVGILFYLTVYRSLRRSPLPRGTAELSVILMLITVPLLLPIRQCGYYSLTLWGVYLMFSSITLNTGKELSWKRFLAGNIILCNTHLLIWGASLALTILATMGVRRKFHACWKPLLFGAGSALPFLCLYQFWRLFERTNAMNIVGFHHEKFWDRWLHYGEMLHAALLPWPILMVGLFFLWLYRHAGNKPVRDYWIMMPIFILGFTGILTFLSPVSYWRYLLPVLPLLCIGFATLIAGLWGYSRPLGLLLFFITLASLSVGVQKTGKLYPYLGQYVYELTHPAEDINEVLCQFINQRAAPDDTILCNYGEFPLQFYTPFKIRGGAGSIGMNPGQTWPEQGIDPVSNPEWVVWRRHWPQHPDFERRINLDHYETYVIPIPDTPWGCRPSPFYHFFRTPTEGEPLIVFHRVKEKDS